jgi:hypothetical protein
LSDVSDDVPPRDPRLEPGVRVVTRAGAGVVVGLWTDPETMSRPARTQPIVRLDEPPRLKVRLDDVTLEETPE